MDRDGLIRQLTALEPLRPDEVELSKTEAQHLAGLKPAQRHEALVEMRREKPKTKAQKTSGMPKSRGDNPNRGKKKGRRA